MRQSLKWKCLRVAVLILLPGLVVLAQQTSSLAIDGQRGQAKVIQVQGKNYVEVDGLARVTGGSIRFAGNQIVLSLPGSSTAPTSAPTQTAATTTPTGFSKEFVRSGVEAMAQVREWHAALRNAIERGYPLSAEWLDAFRRNAQQSLRLAEVAATTDMDHKAFPYLQNEFNNMGALSDKYMQMTKSMNYIAPDSLANDPLDQRLLTCGRSMASMVTSQQFVDEAACQ
ncbi:MAG TPA: hypothetical protein VMJ35_13530 [Dongiaceae bacterium]|nr:hypothetical protein [Dongiaceae bacterium]